MKRQVLPSDRNFKSLMEIVEIKYTVTDMKKAFYRFITRLKTTKERISKFDVRSIEIIQIETQREKKQKGRRNQKKASQIFRIVSNSL